MTTGDEPQLGGQKQQVTGDEPCLGGENWQGERCDWCQQQTIYPLLYLASTKCNAYILCPKCHNKVSGLDRIEQRHRAGNGTRITIRVTGIDIVRRILSDAGLVAPNPPPGIVDSVRAISRTPVWLPRWRVYHD